MIGPRIGQGACAAEIYLRTRALPEDLYLPVYEIVESRV